MEGELTLAYLAGIIDGEGCVSFQSSGAGKRRRFTLQVNMTDRAPLDLLAETFGGNVNVKKGIPQHRKPQWVWRLSSQMARDAYDRLLPFLRIKTIPLNSEVTP